MRRSVFYLGCLLTLMPLTALGQGQCGADLPKEIEQFYQKRNMVAAFSTPAERAMLAAEHGLQNLSNRLKRVDRMMRAIRKQELVPDPAMTMPLDRGYAVVPSQLCEVEHVGLNGKNKMTIEVAVYFLDPVQSFRLIQSYEGGKKLDPTHLISISPVSTRETHVWHYVGERWLREPASMAQLAR